MIISSTSWNLRIELKITGRAAATYGHRESVPALRCQMTYVPMAFALLFARQDFHATGRVYRPVDKHPIPSWHFRLSSSTLLQANCRPQQRELDQSNHVSDGHRIDFEDAVELIRNRWPDIPLRHWDCCCFMRQDSMIASGRQRSRCRRVLPVSRNALLVRTVKSVVLQISPSLSRIDFQPVRILGERCIMYAMHSSIPKHSAK